MNNLYIISRSTKSGKKYMVTSPQGKIIYFGDSHYEDFTTHKDERRKQLYIGRHQKNENWAASGVDTAGFWSRWLLWNQPSLSQSANDISQRFGIDIAFQ